MLASIACQRPQEPSSAPTPQEVIRPATSRFINNPCEYLGLSVEVKALAILEGEASSMAVTRARDSENSQVREAIQTESYRLKATSNSQAPSVRAFEAVAGIFPDNSADRWLIIQGTVVTNKDPLSPLSPGDCSLSVSSVESAK